MNAVEFLQLHTLAGGINNEYSLNVNCITGSDYATAHTATISEFTITIRTREGWDEVGDPIAYNTEQDLLTVLQQVDKISIDVPASGSTMINVGLEILTRGKFKGIEANTDYYYFSVKPVVIKYDPEDEWLIDTFTVGSFSADFHHVPVNFLPYVQLKNYVYSDYYPLINNAQESRLSTFAQESDRVGSGINPTNLVEIRNQTADYAAVQDSNYTDTGWTNARYVGTNTSAITYKGVTPVIAGSSFQGEIFTSASSAAIICGRTLADRVVVELLQSSPTGSLLPVTGSSIFNFTSTVSKIENSVNNRIWLKDSNQIIFTDAYGTVISSSACPIV